MRDFHDWHAFVTLDAAYEWSLDLWIIDESERAIGAFNPSIVVVRKLKASSNPNVFWKPRHRRGDPRAAMLEDDFFDPSDDDVPEEPEGALMDDELDDDDAEVHWVFRLEQSVENVISFALKDTYCIQDGHLDKRAPCWITFLFQDEPTFWATLAVRPSHILCGFFT
jgi:hypothetical protein